MLFDIICHIGDLLLEQGDYTTFLYLDQCSNKIHRQFQDKLLKYDIYLINIYKTIININWTKSQRYEEYKNINHADIINVLDQLEKIVVNIKTSDTDIFIRYNLDILKSMKCSLERYIERYNNKNKDKEKLLYYKDIIFTNKLCNLVSIDNSRKLIREIQNEKRITKLFNNFINGITVFTNKIAYNMNIPEEIHTYYLERLIYNTIWTNILNLPRDKSNFDLMRTIKKAYINCFPNCDIRVKIEYYVYYYNLKFIPIKVIVQYYNNCTLDHTEIYTKKNDIKNKEYIDPVVFQKEIV
jgi:hypothetical protein